MLQTSSTERRAGAGPPALRARVKKVHPPRLAVRLLLVLSGSLN